jgi:hypothetical protein
MGRGASFSAIELELLIENYDKTISEIEKIFREHGYNRTRKSLNRKLEKLRKDGDIGKRSSETVRRAYRQRTREEGPEEIKDEGFGQGFGSGFGSGASFKDDDETD